MESCCHAITYRRLGLGSFFAEDRVSGGLGEVMFASEKITDGLRLRELGLFFAVPIGPAFNVRNV